MVRRIDPLLAWFSSRNAATREAADKVTNGIGGKGRQRLWCICQQVFGGVALLHVNRYLLKSALGEQLAVLLHGQGAGNAAGPAESGAYLHFADWQAGQIAVNDDV